MVAKVLSKALLLAKASFLSLGIVTAISTVGVALLKVRPNGWVITKGLATPKSTVVN